MLRHLSDRASAAIFIALVLGLSLTTANVAEGLILALSPLVAVLVMMLAVTREGHRREGWRSCGLRRPRRSDVALAVVVPTAISLVAFGGAVLLGQAELRRPPADWWSILLVMVATGMVLAFAEEIGWRGYLQPRLDWLGSRRSTLVVGAVWTVWHLPYILLTPYYHADGNRPVVLALFTASVVAFSFVFGSLRRASDSVWPAVVAHCAHNVSFALIADSFISTDHPVVVNEYLAGDTGLLVALGAAVAAAVLARRAAPSR